ncbi:SpoIIE family protein phosphatase [Flavobacterium reichenbachii]|uniref:Serine/threonine protein kinase n=1 Tax=Flavobacterium reichenbachii TaxID=362418 RepID=A0A085ZE31_9FLAO|nr:SpoIIE family protein phosphatase [Flavobacterium reichenbachii]KFF02695.1 serine/threonine protein kinase [Flavobacterium reichenbachii]OXB10728.1 serine/threonine protein kinase [Flavobacterium reichenbachii]
MDSTFSSYKIEDRSLIAFIKREIHNLAIQSGFTTHRAAETDIIVAELTSNLIKYAGGGEFLYRCCKDEKHKEIEIFCIDNGVGIDNVVKIMRDGYSTSNTLGEGLGAIKRLSNDFQMYSIKNWGTVQYIKIGEKADAGIVPAAPVFNHAVLSVNYPGENVCGDAYHIKYSEDGFKIFVGDGLGHGVNAHDAVQMAIKVFERSTSSDAGTILKEMHEGVKKTRGLVATVAVVDYKAQTWNICGIGNINTRIYRGLENKTYTPYNGIIGLNVPRTISSTIVPYLKHQIIIMHSDGLRTRWNLNDMMSIIKQSPGVIAASLYKDNLRGTDDATILVGKIN